MNNSLRLLFGSLGFAAWVLPSLALADDAYVCDGGRLVYARPETLEKLKATDPCVAQYHNPAGTVIAPVMVQRPAAAIALPSTTPLPKAAKGPASPYRDAARTPEAFKPLMLKPALVATPKAAPVKPKPAEATAGTDFRNVRVINTQDGAHLYRHDR